MKPKLTKTQLDLLFDLDEHGGRIDDAWLCTMPGNRRTVKRLHALGLVAIHPFGGKHRQGSVAITRDGRDYLNDERAVEAARAVQEKSDAVVRTWQQG